VDAIHASKHPKKNLRSANLHEPSCVLDIWPSLVMVTKQFHHRSAKPIHCFTICIHSCECVHSQDHMQLHIPAFQLHQCISEWKITLSYRWHLSSPRKSNLGHLKRVADQRVGCILSSGATHSDRRV
jgi:hypothetical protein